jgi:Flp pilus assembly protein TadD
VVTYVSQRKLLGVLEGKSATFAPACALRDLHSSDWVLNPNRQRDLFVALSELRQGRRAASESVLRAAVRAEPENAYLVLALARVQIARRELPAARVTYARARRLDPQLPHALPDPL